MKCATEECEGESHARGLCNKCYIYHKKHGTLPPIVRKFSNTPVNDQALVSVVKKKARSLGLNTIITNVFVLVAPNGLTAEYKSLPEMLDALYRFETVEAEEGPGYAS